MNRFTFSKKQVLIRFVELLFILIWVFPLLWMLITSLKVEEEVITKVIMGEPLTNFDQFVDNWHRLGGTEIVQEVNRWAAQNP